MSRRLDYRLLGPLEVRDGERALPLGGRKQRTLLGILLLHANEVVSTDTLIDGLWGERAPKTAGTALQVYVSNLRKLLSPERLETRTPSYLLHVEPEELDLARFERLAAEANGEDPEVAASALGEALALWRGRPLADFAYDSFAQAEIARLEELRLGAVEQRIDAELELGKHFELVGELEALVAEHPLRERLREQLILALYRCRRQAEALDAYQDARRTLIGELGIEPGAPLRELEQAILRQENSLQMPSASRERSKERQADLLGRINLPLAATPLLGRRLELDEIRHLLGRDEVRLLTLTGPGGTGKTRLALQAAAEAADRFLDGVFWVDLASLRDPALVPSAVTQSAGIRVPPGETATEMLSRTLAEKRALVLLDNAEHLLPLVADVIAALLASGLHLLVTSRERLQLQSEHVYTVPPLRREESISLFDVQTGRSHGERTYIRGGVRRTIEFSVRLLSASELRGWMLDAGFREAFAYGADGEPLTLESRRMTVVGHK